MKGFALSEAIRTTLAEVWAHKLRSSLTLIGVVLGTMAVVVMVTMIEGIKVMVWDGIRGMGFDGVMFVSSQLPEDPTERKKRSLSRGLAARDLQVVSDGQQLIEAVSAIRMFDAVVRAEGIERRVAVYGVTPSYATIHNRQVSAGRWLDEGDALERRKVAVLGTELAAKLFGEQNPIGRRIRIGDDLFRVIGVEARIGNRFASDGWSRREMEGVLVPLATVQAYMRGGQGISLLTVKTAERDRLDLVKSEVERLMRRSHHGIGDFEVENIAEEMVRAEKEVTVMLRNWTIVLAAIAGISLLVGGVGIYSVLKISLVERLYEIGLRKSIGATDRAILTQFLVESTTLSVLGALIGCLFAWGITLAASGQFEAGLPISGLGLVLGISFAVAVGVFAGIFPALSASRLMPIDALRG